MTTAPDIVVSLTEVLASAGHPITESQSILLVGALAVWLEKVRKEERDQVRDDIGGPVSGVIRR